MKRTAVIGTLSVLLASLAASASAGPTHKLGTAEARSAAKSAAFEFLMRNDLDSSTVGRCKRSAPRRIVCSATVSGESTTTIKTCELRIGVREVYRSFYWDQAAVILERRCRSEQKPLLSYPVALAAIQAEADRFAGQPTTITFMNRRDDVTFTGSATWERTRVPPNEVFPTETCSVDLVATLASTVSVTTDGFLCY
jgi:hypothetical protein